MHSSRWIVAVLSVASTACATITLPLRSRSVVSSAPPAALQVPYVAQSELLCGGAAIAMIERWWGRRGVFAEDFADLVRRASGGILTSDMTAAMRSRGWDTQELAASGATVQLAIADSVPVIALIRVAANRYHYVVILAWNGGRVTYHDPAAAPFVAVSERVFEERWTGARHWALIARPSALAPTVAAPPSSPAGVAGIDSLPCRPWLDQAADAAATTHFDEADRLLGSAVLACPAEPLVLRELAGLRFRQGRHPEALRLANEYARRAPADSLGWQLLASSRYLAGDARGALLAWNAIGRPTIDLVSIEGSHHSRFRVLADAMGTPPRSVLTPTALSIGQRRLAELPALSAARLSYRAVAGGVVEARAVVAERPLTEPFAQLIVTQGGRALFSNQATLAVSSPLRRGEMWTAYWRWESADPRVALRLDMPVRIGIPAIVSLERRWEAYRFTTTQPSDRRTLSAIGVRGWLRPDLEQLIGARFERWEGAGSFAATSIGSALHKADDRVIVLLEAEHATPVSAHTALYDRLRMRGTWRLPADRWKNVARLRVGSEWVSAQAPRGLWPIAGGNLIRDIPLRAHPIIVDDVLSNAQVGRAAIHGGMAVDRPLLTVGLLAVGTGAFLDGARMLQRADGASSSAFYLDGGAGLRFAVVGTDWATVHVDVARGLAADRRWGLTVGLADGRWGRPGRAR